MIITQIFFITILIVLTKQQSNIQLQNHDYIMDNLDQMIDVAELPAFYESPLKSTMNLSPYAPMAPEEERLLNNYRLLIAKTLINLDDSCKVYEFLIDVGREWSKRINDGVIDENSNGNYLNLLLQMIRNSNERHILSNNNDSGDLSAAATTTINDENNKHGPEHGSENSQGMTSKNLALYYFLTTSSYLKDSELDRKLRNLLYEKCCRDSSNGYVYNQKINCQVDKRNTIKKIRFHSWGGKRNQQEVPKVVIRTPFRPWGGKRSSLSSSIPIITTGQTAIGHGQSLLSNPMTENQGINVPFRPSSPSSTILNNIIMKAAAIAAQKQQHRNNNNNILNDKMIDEELS